MRRLFASCFSLALLTASPAFAVMEDYPSVKLQGLDKSVGRTVTFEAKVGSTIQYGPLYIKIQACRKTPPIEKPEAAAFLQIWEVPPGEQKSQWDFSGWMFSSSPALSPMDHPVYDVWVLDCTGREEPNEEAAAAQTDKDADQESLPADGVTPPPVPDAGQEPVPTDSEAQPEEDTSAQDPVPADSEAEQQGEPSVEINPDAAPAPAYNPDAPYSPQAYPNAAPATDARPQDPTSRGEIAYDFMNQPGANAPRQIAPQQQYVPEQRPGFDPNAPYSPDAYPADQN